MFIVIGLMLTGVLIGWVARKHCLKFLQQIIPVFIWLLLFLLGVEVGDMMPYSVDYIRLE